MEGARAVSCTGTKGKGGTVSRKIRVVLADDQELVRSGFAMILSIEENIEVVGEAANGVEAVELARTLQPDVVLMDVQMPLLDGIAATAQICAGSSASKVLILTTFDREDYLFEALRAGASGFLLKTSDADDLVEAIVKVASGFALLSPEMTVPLIREWVEHGQQQSQQRPLTAQERLMVDSLTQREVEVLSLLAEGMTNAEIAERLFLGAATVKTHVSNILAKTQSRDRVNAVIFAHRTGIAPGTRR